MYGVQNVCVNSRKIPLKKSTEAEGITDLLLQVTKAADTADTSVTHSYFH